MTKNQNKFDQFYRKHQEFLSRFLLSLGVRQDEILLEIKQETFFEAYKNFSQLRLEIFARSWLATIARRQLAQWLRRERYAASFVLWQDEFHSESVDMEAAFQNESLAHRVLSELAAIGPDKQRSAMIAFYLEEKKLKEISRELDVPLSTLTTWCSRFRLLCQNSCQPETVGQSALSPTLAKKGLS